MAPGTGEEPKQEVISIHQAMVFKVAKTGSTIKKENIIMWCKDKKCLDRLVNSHHFCTNSGCSHSAHKNTFPIHEMVSKIIITADCSSDMIKKLQSWRLRPTSFKINSWQTTR
jgi:hypothetical protein